MTDCVNSDSGPEVPTPNASSGRSSEDLLCMSPTVKVTSPTVNQTNEKSRRGLATFGIARLATDEGR